MGGLTAEHVRIGRCVVRRATRAGAVDAIADLVAAKTGGMVFTPNVDHVVMCEDDAAFAAAYDRADLVFADGMPLVWASKLTATPLPERVSGSDLVRPLARRAAADGWRVYLLGGRAGAAAESARRLTAEYGTHVVGIDDAVVRLDDEEGYAAVLARIAAARPDLVLVALGSPKQEVWLGRVRAALSPAVAIGVGASLDFVAGQVRRAPAWMARAGFEWLFRLCQEPGRLWRRYLLRDPKFVWIVLRQIRESGIGARGSERRSPPDSRSPIPDPRLSRSPQC